MSATSHPDMKRKSFDCVAMKDRLQQELQESLRGLNPAEERAEIRRRLEQSGSPVARLWREVRTADTHG